MLHIIGWIFKCILILLGVLIGLALLLAAIVLFVPVRYEGRAEFPGTVEEIHGWLKITWLLHLVRADVKWENGELKWNLRAAWKSFGEKAEERVESDAPKVPKKKEKPEKSEKDKSSGTVKNVSTKSEENPIEKDSTPKTQKKIEHKIETEKKEHFFKKIKNKIVGFWREIKYTIQRFCVKIKEGMDWKNTVLEFLREKVHKSAFQRVKKELVWLKRFFKIKRIDIRLRFGFEDPSVTGKVLGFLGVLYAMAEGNIDVTPEFEEKCLEGRIYLKGRMRIIYIVVPAIHLITDKAVRQTYKDFKEWKES